MGMERDLCNWQACGAISLQTLGKTEALLLENIEMLLGICTQFFCLFVLFLI